MPFIHLRQRNLTGGSKLHAFDTNAKEMDISTAGGSWANVRVQEKLTAEASDGSIIRYWGNPKEKTW